MTREKIWVSLGLLALLMVIAMAIALLKFKAEGLGIVFGSICLGSIIVLDSVAIRRWIIGTKEE